VATEGGNHVRLKGVGGQSIAAAGIHSL
jgi:hypothetical protein